MAILTVDEFREHVTTALEDDAVQRLLDAAEAEIVRAAGAPGSTTDIVPGGSRLIALSRPASSITSVTETRYSTSTVLAANDYLLHPGGFILERLYTGTNPSYGWRGQATVAYTPVDDEAIRIGVQLDLVQLALNSNPGTTAETIGSWTEQLASNSAWNASKERASILSRLTGGPSMVVI